MTTPLLTSVFRPQGGVSVIAEPANTHNGSVEYVVEISRASARAGVDAITYQVFEPHHLSAPDDECYKVHQQIAIPYDRWKEIIADTRSAGLVPVAEVFDASAARFCASQDVRAFKLNTVEASTRSLIDVLRAEASVVFVGVAGSELHETHRLLERLSGGRADVVLQYGFQSNPMLPEHSYLAKIPLLALHFGLPICFADHVAGDDPLALELPCLAVTAGATSLEKHVVLTRTSDRYDYYSAIEPAQLAALVERVRRVEVCLGPQSLALHGAELEYRDKHRKCPVLRQTLPAGHLLTDADLDFKRANGPKDFVSLEEVVGRTLATTLPALTALRREHLA